MLSRFWGGHASSHECRDLSWLEVHDKKGFTRPSSLRVTLLRFLSPASFWSPDYICQSAWIEHAPFAFWISDVLRPRCFVELGTHYGYSYFAFCQAIERLGLGTAAYAVDSWQGDEHAGFYGEDVFQAVAEQNTKKYAAFSRLIRSTFDEAVQNFEDCSIDLLHIDGRHFYKDVKHDFETWQPKLSDNAIVLFHDTSVRERGFGVWEFFKELSASRPSFQFFHCYGLGVLAIGEPPAALAPLFESSVEEAGQIRAAYTALGKGLSVRLLLTEQNVQLAERDARLAELETDLTLSKKGFEADLNRLYEAIAARDAQIKEYLYHLDRINASGWWRLGMWIDKQIRSVRALFLPRESKVNSAPAPQVSSVLVPTETEPPGTRYVPLCKGSPVNKKRAKLICFYLPQFHTIPENDAWWGEGFTEWTNVRAAQPQFKGHYQPRIPDELGYYNLLNSEVQRRQIELAKLYGVEGFCFYFYWFGGKRLLESPVETYLQDNTLDLPFCLCWANENWTRRWDGLESEILIAQRHSPKDDLAFIQYVSRYMADSRYIRVNGKPLLIIYRPMLLPSPKETVKRWRAWCRSSGVGEIYLCYTQSFEKVDPAEYGFDAAIEFPPNMSVGPSINDRFPSLGNNSNSTIYDWREFVDRSENYQQPKYKLFRSVCPAWDNTARRKNGATIFVNSTPALYQRWLNNAIRDTKHRHANPDEQLIFVNAWNEWGEGAYLEPDKRYGYAYLQATRDAVCSAEHQHDPSILLVTHDCHANGAQFLILEIAKQLKVDGFKVAIIALDGGKLESEFALIGRMINAKEAGASGIQNFLAGLREEGTQDAITSTVVSGSIVSELKSLGFRVLSLIHELPGIIHEMRQEVNAAAIASLADKVVFPAKLVRQRFNEIAPVSDEKVVIRHQGLLRKNPYKNRNAEAHHIICEKHGLPPDTQIVLSIAYADLRKGPDLFVEIAAHVVAERPKTTFIWVGNGPPEMEQKVNLRIQQLGLEGRVLFVDFDREPMAYYAAASAYALPSREDPFPNVVLESAEVGVPAVAFDGVTGAGEFIVEHGGRLASYPDTADFARCLCELLARTESEARSSVPSLQQYTLDLLYNLKGYPRVSVIVPNYNYERHISKRLDSIFHQTFPVYEVIVLDDASTDKSVEVIEDYFERTCYEGQLIVNKCNSGSVFHQWQKGLACSKGDLIWIAEADDVADIHFLRELTPCFGDPNIVLAFSQSKQIDENGKVLAENYLEYTKDVSDRWCASYVNDGYKEISECLSVKNTIPNVSAVLFRRDALEQSIADIGDDLFRYKVAGDWLVYLHVLLRGRLCYNEKSLNYHRRHTKSVTSALDVANHLKEVCELQERAQSLSAPSGEALAKAKAYIEYLHENFEISTKS